MSPLRTNLPKYGPCFSVMDFFTFTETMRTNFYPDNPVPSFEISDLIFAINAPLDYYPPAEDKRATVYFDQPDCSRTLPYNSYQVRCADRLNTHEFIKWAEQGIEMIHVALMHKGLICIDLVDLTDVLQTSKSQKLILEIIPYIDTLELPWENLQRYRFKTLFAALFASHDLTMQMIADLGCALEEINPNIDRFRLAATFHMHHFPVVMLLGELES